MLFRSLWSEVLRQGILDAASDIIKKDRGEPTLWLYVKDERVGSFVWLCKLLGLDPAIVRRSTEQRASKLKEANDARNVKRRKTPVRDVLEEEVPDSDGLSEGVTYCDADIGIDDDPVGRNEEHFVCCGSRA